MKSRNKRDKDRVKYRKKNLSGKAIASGGYGCVFQPALLCRNNSDRTSGISKLLVNKNANDEFKETLTIKPIIDKIPNNSKYFLVNDITKCKPNRLTSDDLINFDKCTNLKKRGITVNNINKNINKLTIINIPYGGIDLDKYIKRNNPDLNQVAVINAKLIRLLKNAIFPMNRLRLIHNDIKGANILYNETDGEMRIIDWGFGEIIGLKIPEQQWSRPLQYNVPFSSTLFIKSFNQYYKAALEKLSKSKMPFDINNIKEIAIHYFRNAVSGHGHYNYLFMTVFPKLYKILHNRDIDPDQDPDSDPDNDEIMNFGTTIIVDYLAEALYRFTDFNSKQFDFTRYYFEVYSKNVDVWGLLSTYISILFYMYQTDFHDTAVKTQIIKYIIDIIYKYLYSPTYAAIAIDKDVLVADMNKINKLFAIADSDSDSDTRNSDTRNSDTRNSDTRNRKISAIKRLARCPNGSRRNKKTGLCIKNQNNQNNQNLQVDIVKKLRRCPNKTRRNRKTGLCEKY